MDEVFENDFVYLKQSNDILYVTYKPDALITIEAAKKVVEDRMRFVNGESKYIVAEVSNIKSSTKEAREYLSKKDGGLQGIIAGAFVSKNAYSYFIINLFLKITNPKVPAKFFPDKESALDWIDQLKRVYKN